MTVLTDRFARAVDYARIAHAAQVRKGTDIPYITHLLGGSRIAPVPTPCAKPAKRHCRGVPRDSNRCMKAHM